MLIVVALLGSVSLDEINLFFIVWRMESKHLVGLYADD
jgi:hypothetical protein